MSDPIGEAIREHYALEARARREKPEAPSRLYGPALTMLAPGLAGFSFGCGDPLTLVELKKGQRVLDVGCGAGVDVALAAQAVGAAGQVVGVDVTPEMVALAREHASGLGLSQVQIIEGDLIELDLPDGHFDRVISNATIHLAPDRPALLVRIRELLKDDGVFALCDMAVSPELPALLRDNRLIVPGLLLHGSLPRLDQYLADLHEAGFESVEMVARLPFDPRATLESIAFKSLNLDAAARERLTSDLAAVEFQVIHVVAHAREPREQVPAACPCGNVQPVDLISPLDTSRSPGLVVNFMEGRLNGTRCMRCGGSAEPLAPFMVIDHENKRLVHVFPAQAIPQRAAIESQAQFFLKKWLEATGRHGYTCTVAFGVDAGRALFK